ncbi:MAG: polymer-forming cytoskeletal protein [Rhodospirillaceae bacterium]|nr:polymer-forming cytoskeletal protein [Rhodospirillaceae bacterium]MBT5265093.1 polymer-forming cytoskeletal protein [Rhodospirillaceae bacterium]MBT6139332.1 polymer-forming cytoskeletal protein [Rhodospirillaceae bacterium]
MFRRNDSEDKEPKLTEASGSGTETSSGDKGSGDQSAVTQSGSGSSSTSGSGFVPEIPRRTLDLPGAPGGPARRGAPRVGNVESKRLSVGRDISLSGEITACDTLVVEGTVDATLENSRLLEVTDSGTFRGKVQIEDAEIAGVFEGDLSVRNRLFIRSTGRVTGTISFGKLEVELGGVLSGDINVLSSETE